MSVEAKVYSALSGSTALTTLVGSAIYPELRMQSVALPAVVYSRASGFRVNSLQGYSNLENADIQVTVYTKSIDTRITIGNAVIGAISSAAELNALVNDSPTDFYDDETEVFERSIMFSVWNRE